jgi:hypothetical protein
MAGRKASSEKDRFLEKVVRHPDGCWKWSAFCMKNGYGLFRRADRHHLAHRVSYELFVGHLPAGMEVMHVCDNRNCVNPEHLCLGTHVDNVKDCLNKKRHAFGVRHGLAKLSEDQVRDIRAASGTQRTIAKQYDISQAQVSDIKLKKRWAYLQ